MGKLIDFDAAGRSLRGEQAGEPLEYLDCSPAMQRALLAFWKTFTGADLGDDAIDVAFVPAMRAAIRALKYEDGTDEGAAIRASAPLKFDAVITIECFEAMLDEVLR